MEFIVRSNQMMQERTLTSYASEIRSRIKNFIRIGIIVLVLQLKLAKKSKLMGKL